MDPPSKTPPGRWRDATTRWSVRAQYRKRRSRDVRQGRAVRNDGHLPDAAHAIPGAAVRGPAPKAGSTPKQPFPSVGALPRARPLGGRWRLAAERLGCWPLRTARVRFAEYAWAPLYLVLADRSGCDYWTGTTDILSWMMDRPGERRRVDLLVPVLTRDQLHSAEVHRGARQLPFPGPNGETTVWSG